MPALNGVKAKIEIEDVWVSVIVVDALNGNAIVDGQTLTITDNHVPSVTRTFEFDDGTGLPIASGRVAIPFNVGMDQTQEIVHHNRSLLAYGSPGFCCGQLRHVTQSKDILEFFVLHGFLVDFKPAVGC